MGEIITFYSYKGGVGRTMALANIAIVLSKWGYEVLAVDWDLEAPGLEFYFRNLSDSIGGFQNEGVLELLECAQNEMGLPPRSTKWRDLVLEIKLPISRKPLHFITAGKRSEDYFNRVRALDLQAFYDQKAGGIFIESLRNEWKQAYDFVLIDSRTGITDIGGVCTIQFPDILVLLFAANDQSLAGAVDVAKKAYQARKRLPFDRFSLLRVPIPSRFDSREEFTTAQEWLDRFADELSDLYASWLPRSVEIRDFLEITKLPYIPYFSFGERLPFLEQGAVDPTGLGYAYESLAALIANKLESAEQLLENRSKFISLASAEPIPPVALSSLVNTVESLLTVMGFVCQERQTAADRVRLVCTGKGAFARPMAVVCKDGAVERGDTEALLAEVKTQGLSGGVLVTHARVSPAARRRAVETDDLVRAFTLDELYHELIDFEPYVRALVADYEGDELSTYYVDLGCQGSDGSVYKPMDGYVDRWLDDPTRNHISILGDYGTGKTSFCRQYAAKLGRRWLADPDHCRIPILISLRHYAKAVDLKQLVTDFLVNRYGIQAGYEAFRRFNADGKLLLLFDGFDEMAQKVDYQTTVDNFEELARAVEARSKVLLTCRTPYFRTREEAKRLLSWREPEALIEARDLAEQVAIDLTERPNFEIVHLLPLQPEDIQMMLRARFPAEWQGYWQQIEDTYNLKELAQRPVLLDMIARSLPHLKPGQAVNAAQLYEAYTDLWLLRDEEKGRTLISRADRRLFMQELALEMLRREELSIHFSRLPERVRAHFHLEKAAEIDYFEHDIRTCSFLNRDGEGNYRFVHKSFGEFFVAQWLAPRLLEGSAPAMRINEEMRGFVRGLLAGADWPPPPPPDVIVPEGMVWVPAGPFIYGEGEGTQVVRLEQGFFIARTPVTNAQYARFVAATNHGVPKHWRGKTPPDKLRNHPVVNVNWDDALAYAEWTGGRLPTEQEWEKAARGIDGRIYPWGDEFDAARCNAQESGIGTTTSVDHYSPDGDSPCGCTDMAGTVWEWTASEHEPGRSYRAVRGGSFVSDQDFARCASRYRFNPRSDWGDYCGFRVVVSPVSPAFAL